MSKHSFMLTYSVSPAMRTDESKTAANKARNLIGELDNATKLEDVETTLVGTIELHELDSPRKRTEARDLIMSVIKDKLSGHVALGNVKIDCAMTVDGLGKHISFTV